MLPYLFEFQIGPFTGGIPTFPLLIFAALGVFVLIFWFLSPDLRRRPYVFLIIMGIVFVAGAVGAKTGQVIIEMLEPGQTKPFWEVFANSGSTVTTGMLGAFGAIVFLAWRDPWKVMNWRTLDVFAASIPLAHAIGRLGCVVNGCCYGEVCTDEIPFALTYPANWIGRNTDPFAQLGPRFPAPLYEAGLLVLLAVFLIILYRSTKSRGQILPLYLIGYGLIRFFVEQFRGDTIRGIYMGLATGQWFSLLIVLFGFILLVVYIVQLKRGFAHNHDLCVNGKPLRTDNTYASKPLGGEK